MMDEADSPIANEFGRVFHDTLPWLVSFSLDVKAAFSYCSCSRLRRRSRPGSRSMSPLVSSLHTNTDSSLFLDCTSLPGSIRFDYAPLRSPPAQRQARRRFNLRCAPIRTVVVRHAG